ncbi:hypothetical protein KAR91_71090, partial [Candidatus Pacearchaeota archaeon]|nr:hypothetical protein [Candidatus Pacearchaeota archaeon]
MTRFRRIMAKALPLFWVALILTIFELAFIISQANAEGTKTYPPKGGDKTIIDVDVCSVDNSKTEYNEADRKLTLPTGEKPHETQLIAPAKNSHYRNMINPEFIQRFKIEWSRPLIEEWKKSDKVSKKKWPNKGKVILQWYPFSLKTYVKQNELQYEFFDLRELEKYEFGVVGLTSGFAQTNHSKNIEVQAEAVLQTLDRGGNAVLHLDFLNFEKGVKSKSSGFGAYVILGKFLSSISAGTANFGGGSTGSVASESAKPFYWSLAIKIIKKKPVTIVQKPPVVEKEKVKEAPPPVKETLPPEVVEEDPTEELREKISDEQNRCKKSGWNNGKLALLHGKVLAWSYGRKKDASVLNSMKREFARAVKQLPKSRESRIWMAWTMFELEWDEMARKQLRLARVSKRNMQVTVDQFLSLNEKELVLFVEKELVRIKIDA